MLRFPGTTALSAWQSAIVLLLLRSTFSSEAQIERVMQWAVCDFCSNPQPACNIAVHHYANARDSTQAACRAGIRPGFHGPSMDHGLSGTDQIALYSAPPGDARGPYCKPQFTNTARVGCPPVIDTLYIKSPIIAQLEVWNTPAQI
ncbi:hypothetical protein FIBSPDRAFT_885840 [Athelia psychrophila]|uniref:Uncharacterized protein n=1 Tax=Athelia psychrophila TaxID=1759441 RepID=A0A166RGU2_9AGAM|nr:hypothetical protein FIBSPDRAFT_885840 [Fibularhizoctonia sp. CBS 109695]